MLRIMWGLGVRVEGVPVTVEVGVRVGGAVKGARVEGRVAVQEANTEAASLAV